jgi:PP-loop superfamily ATP-utilizing enzyme
MQQAIEPSMRRRIVEALREIGYRHVVVDLQGYRMGSLNDGVRLHPA